MSDFNSRNDYTKYVGGNTSSNQDSLPMQMLPRSKKNDKWQKHTMDTLENIGLKQIRENRVFADYRKMQQGRLVYSDFDETQTDLKGIASVREGQKLPTFLKHYDLIGRIINLLAGEFNKQKDTINIVSTDIFSTGEFLREKDSRIRKFTEDYFNKELEIGLIEKGIDPFKNDFNSEEEKQQYLQKLQEERNSIIPPDEIENDLKKNFKTAIVEWAEKTMESNYIKFSLEMLDTEELIDYLATGRYFRNYHVGYDSYEPETWDVERTFFSQDQEAKYPQDCEYVGTIHLLSGARLLSRYGHLIPKNIQNKIYGEDFYGSSTDSVGPMNFIENAGGKPTSVPHAGYYQQQTAQAFQNLTGVPLGKQYFTGEDGKLDSRYSWVQSNDRGNSLGWGKMFRDDINVRNDQVQLTESYFRSQKLMGLLTIENPLVDTPYQVMVEEALVPEFLEQYEIKKQSTKSWKEVVDNPLDNINTITYGFLPQIWKGHKINATGTNLKEDYYFGIEPLEYQITGAKNEFDVKIPVAGIISSGIGEMIRAFQIDYNIVMNQNRQYLEKTIGAFFMMDWNLLPSQFKNENGENTAELLEEWRETIRETGMGVTDGSPRNTAGQNPNQNNIQQYDISFNQNIQMNTALARDYEDKAFAMIGITRERAGNPNEYMTGAGVKQGVEASYAQTEVIYKRFNTAKVKEKELELAVAQYATGNKKDISVNYINGQNERIIQNFVDPNFAFRKIEVYPADDSSKRRELETFKQKVIEDNTLGNSMHDMAKIVTSDSFVSVLEHGLSQEKKKQEELQQEREYQKELLDKQNQGILQVEKERQANSNNESRLNRESQEYQTEVKARAVLADSNVDTNTLDDFFKKEKLEQDDRDRQKKNDMKSQELDLKKKKQEYDASNDMSKVDEMFLKMRENAKDRQARLKQSEDKVTVARVNT
jgi:hypothetical protein